LESDTRTSLWASIAFATFWNLISSPILFVLNVNRKKKLRFQQCPIIGIPLS
jgi:hypothetical protein